MSLSAAFFISPLGELIVVKDTHIKTVLRNPGRFGLTRGEIVSVHQQHGERLGMEGKARREILSRLIAEGWIRIRRYPDYWSVNVDKMTPETNALLTDWAQKVLGGIDGFKELDRHMPVKITGCGYQWELTVEELADAALKRQGREVPA